MSVRALKTLAKRGWHRSFRILQRAGINFLPAHFYSCIPDLDDLTRRSDWRKPRSMYGIAHRDIDGQLALLGEWFVPHGEHRGQRSVHADAIVGGGADGGYGEIEAEVLFAFVAANKPTRIVQVGCGVSTAVMVMGDSAAERPAASACLRHAEQLGAALGNDAHRGAEHSIDSHRADVDPDHRAEQRGYERDEPANRSIARRQRQRDRHPADHQYRDGRSRLARFVADSRRRSAERRHRAGDGHEYRHTIEHTSYIAAAAGGPAAYHLCQQPIVMAG